VNTRSRMHWRDILAAFNRSFPSPPKAEDVRNWNTVHCRRKHYRGIIHRQHWKYVCSVEAQEELEEDLCTSRRVPQGIREFHLLDWHKQFSEGQEVHFVAFPNPCMAERDTVSRIVRLLNVPEAIPAQPGVPDEFQCGAARDHVASQFGLTESASVAPHGTGPRPSVTKNSASPVLQACSSPSFASHARPILNSDDSSLATSCSAFEDLVQWSKESPEAEPAAALRAFNPSAACDLGLVAQPRIHLSLESALQLDGEAHSVPNAGRPRHNQAGTGKGLRSSPRAHVAKPPPLQSGAPNATHQPWCSQLPATAGCRPPGVLRSPPFRSPFAGKGRSPMICPRSPFAAYFDD